MTWRKREIMEMAREAGVIHPENVSKTLEAFAKLVREDEREACAKLVDHILKEGGGTWGDAIRARGQTPCNHEWIDATTTKPQWHCAKCGKEYTKEQA
jgi:hypothetical protein